MAGLAQRNAQRQAAASREYSLPSPTGGLNTRDNKAAMSPVDAVTLTNWVPGPDGVISRKGYVEHLTGLESTVETIIEYHSSSTQKMVLGSGSKLYTGTATAGTATELGTGYTSARWQGFQHTANLVLLNGADTPQVYNGSTVSNGTHTGSGLTPANLKSGMVHQGRAFYMENAAPHFWYAGPGAFQGTLSKFDLSEIASEGGNLAAMASWSRDGGNGPDDYAVFFMTTGEVLIYVGTNPGDASFWSLTGRYYIGSPLDVRGVVPYGTDVYVMTKSDFIPMTQVLALGRITEGVSKLSGAAQQVARDYADNTGWQAILYPRGNWLLFNIPVTTKRFDQYGINTQNGAAFKFEGWNSYSFGVAFDRLYMGGDGVVYLCDEGFKDGGSAIQTDAQQAFSDFGDRQRKQVTTFSPVHQTDGNVTLRAAIAYDYQGTTTSQTVSSESTSQSWDDITWANWVWALPNVLRRPRYSSARGEGRAVSLRMRADVLGQQIKWYRTDFLYKRLTGF